MLDKAFKCLFKAGLKIELIKCSFIKEQMHYLGHLVCGMSILPLANKIEVLMKLKPLTNIKEVNYADIVHPLNCLMQKSQPLIWTPECQSSFDMLCS